MVELVELEENWFSWYIQVNGDRVAGDVVLGDGGIECGSAGAGLLIMGHCCRINLHRGVVNKNV